MITSKIMRRHFIFKPNKETQCIKFPRLKILWSLIKNKLAIKQLTTITLLLILVFSSSFLIVHNKRLNPSTFSKRALKETEPFTLTFRVWASKSDDTEWSDWKEGKNIFVFNYNKNGDVLHYKSGGKKELYTLRNNWEEKIKDDNIHSIAQFIRENGDEIYIQVYRKPRIMVKVILGSSIFQFDNPKE